MTATKNYDAIYATPVGYIGVNLQGDTLTGLNFLGKKITAAQGRLIRLQDNAVGRALKDYFTNPEVVQRPSTELRGTEFQNKVWLLMAAIPAGSTRTYGDIAKELKTSPRAVGNACRENPVPIFIPCHRVVSKSGKGGFMGQTRGTAIVIKDWLLAHEKQATHKY